MTDEAKQQAWQERCAKLEALGVDPYAPMPTDEDSRLQVQAILKEYEIAIGNVIPVPPSWEGAPPIDAIDTLPALAEWLANQWRSTVATEMGGDGYKAMAVEQGLRAVQNGFRVLAWLGVEDRPAHPLPPETVADAKKQIYDLEQWVRQKIKEGWQPSKAEKPVDAEAVKPAKRRKRSEVPDDYEANILIKQHLDKNPNATIREVAEAVDLSTGKVSGMDAWRREIARRKAAKPLPKIKERPLTNAMIEAIGRNDDPTAKMEVDEAIWRRIMEEASQEQRAELHGMKSDERQKLIDTAREQYADDLADEEQYADILADEDD